MTGLRNRVKGFSSGIIDVMTNQTTVLALPTSIRWLTSAATSLADYQGRPLVLAFVNAASAWSLQRLEELALWERRNPGLIQVLVVLVPRFDFEQSPGRSLSLLRRSGCMSDAVFDPHWHAWHQLGISHWPTLVLVDEAGRERDRLVGSGTPLEVALARLCQGVVPVEVPYGRLVAAQPGVSAPTGLIATEDRLYIADSGHHRVLECDHRGRVLRRFGSGLPDFLDGPADEAAFRRPHSLAMDRTSLYVSDVGNHAVRRINLLAGTVDTLVGNGRQGDVVEGPLARPAGSPLSQPLGMAIADNQLYFAQAGDNAVWRFELGGNRLTRTAGTGALGLRDGGGLLATLAQPTALLAVRQVLYVLDALSSSLRAVQLTDGSVQTLIGMGVWQFGHQDGPRGSAMMQFPLAMAMLPESGWLWIADAGNGVLRKLRLGGGTLETVQLPRSVPGVAGLAVTRDHVWLADTEGNAILRYDPVSGSLAEVTIGE